MTPEKVIKLVRDNKVEVVDFRFTDIPGTWQHFSIPAQDLTPELFEEGVGFDGSSIRGFQSIEESDMILLPDPETAFLDPFTAHKTLCIICNVKDPVTLERYTRDPRYIAQKAEQHMRSAGFADTAYFGPEAEFYVFDDIRFDQTYNEGYYHIDSVEGQWNTGKAESPNLGHKPRYKEGYFPVPPVDKMQDIRSEMILTMQEIGIQVEVHHHEVGTAGQAEIDMRYDTLLKMCDKLMKYKYVVKNVAAKSGKTATFMPKPLFQDNGSGMHTHQSIWQGGKNLFFKQGEYGNVSETCLYYIGGLIKHCDAVMAFAAPTTNSYRRLVPGYEAPINLIYSQRNRSACVRIPVYSTSEKAKRIEFRPPDPSCNPYLAFAAMLMAGLDGIENKITPPDPIDKDLYDLPAEEAKKVKSTPPDLASALDALEEDHEFLLKGDVFTPDVIETWLNYKRIRELDQIRLRPHPHEFALYYDV